MLSVIHCSYAEVVITSEESLKTLLEKIPKCEINGERVDCRYATRQNLAIFEEMANKRKNALHMVSFTLYRYQCDRSLSRNDVFFP